MILLIIIAGAVKCWPRITPILRKRSARIYFVEICVISGKEASPRSRKIGTGSPKEVESKANLPGNRHDRFITFEGKLPGIDFKKLVDKAFLFRNRNDNIRFFGIRKTDDAF